jgi:hypothetical protein
LRFSRGRVEISNCLKIHETFAAAFLRLLFEPGVSSHMTPQRWQQVKAILADAIERDDALQRAAFVESSCDGDLLLKQEVEALLAYADDPMAINRSARVTSP